MFVKPSDGRRRISVRTALDVLATIALLVAAAAVTRTTIRGPLRSATPPQRPPVPLPTEPVSLEEVPVLGDPNAKIAIVVFSDFECPFCGRFSRDVLPSIKRDYIDSGRVQLVFRHFPLDRIHRRARPAAEAGECAARQGKFWTFHDAMFSDPVRLEPEDLLTYARTVGLNVETFRSCIDGESAEHVRTDSDLARVLKVPSTPTFLLGTVQDDRRVRVTQIITGARSASEFDAALRQLATQGAVE